MRSHALMRSGGSSLTPSTSIAFVRAPDSSLPYASETNGSSEYDVISFSATVFQVDSKPSMLPSGDAATSSRASERMRCCCSPSRTSVWNACASRSVDVSPEITCRDTKREIVVSVIRLTTACISGGPSSSPWWPIMPSSRSGEQRPTADAMFFSTGSSCSGFFLETTSTMPRSMRIIAAVLRPMPPPLSAVLSSDAIRSTSFSLSAAMPSSSRTPASSRSNELPSRQLVMTRFQTTGSPPERSRRTSA